jgi:hypothetical protein
MSESKRWLLSGNVTMHTYRSIEVESHTSDGYVNLVSRGDTLGSVSFAANPDAGREAYDVNMIEFDNVVSREDVSLSEAERMSLLDAILEQIDTELALPDTPELPAIGTRVYVFGSTTPGHERPGFSGVVVQVFDPDEHGHRQVSLAECTGYPSQYAMVWLHHISGN